MVGDSEVRRDPAIVAAIISIVLAVVSAFVFLSHVMIFVFPIMPLGTWLGWEGRNSKLRVVAWIGFAVCLALTLLWAFIGLQALLG